MYRKGTARALRFGCSVVLFALTACERDHTLLPDANPGESETAALGDGSDVGNAAMEADAGGLEGTESICRSPQSCEADDCGPIADGCGGLIDCGGCEGGATCGGAGPSKCGVGSNTEGCAPTTCDALAAQCGQHADGCGGLLDCGGCSAAGAVCMAGTCVARAACTPRTCADVGPADGRCGPLNDGCGGTITCDGFRCSGEESCGAVEPGRCGTVACDPLTCDQALVGEPAGFCGSVADGCGGILAGCGTVCSAPETCGGGGVPDVCGESAEPCVALTTAACGSRCGAISDGCGGSIECAGCTAPETCGGGGVPGVCGAPACQPATCASEGFNCGVAADGCGGSLESCGSCAENEVCNDNVCELEPAACEPLETDAVCAGLCGEHNDGCEGIVNCGGCAAPNTCGGGGTPSVCGGAPPCVPRTCAEVGATCGPIGDGCGGSIPSCGICSAPETCGGGGVASQCGHTLDPLGSDWIFDESVVRTYEVSLPPEDWVTLQETAIDEEYVPADVSVDGNVVQNVGLRFKGGLGTLVSCFEDGQRTCPKLSMKIKFSEYDREQRFRGLRRLSFNSMLNDPSQLRERLGYRVFRQMGLVVPRAVHGRLIVNGEDQGLFTVVENVDGTFTDHHFRGGDGNLYKELWPDTDDLDFINRQLRTNEEMPDHGVFLGMYAELSNAADDELTDVLANYFDLDVLFAHVAVDEAIRNWDGFGAFFCQEGYCENHNYYLYQHEREPRFTLIPWDLDNTFQPDSPLDAIPPFFEEPLDCQQTFFAVGRQVQPPGCDLVFRALARASRQRYVAQLDRLLAGVFDVALMREWLGTWRDQIDPIVAIDDAGPGLGFFRQSADQLSAGLDELRDRLVTHRSEHAQLP